MGGENGQPSVEQHVDNEDRPRVKRYRRAELDEEEKVDVLDDSGEEE